MNTRPTPPNRLSVGAASNAHSRQTHPRSHSHSLSVGSINPLHRVGRRKSTSSNASLAVAVAAVNIVAENALEGTTSVSWRNNGKQRGVKSSSGSTVAASLPAGHGFAQSAFESKPTSSALTEALSELPELEKSEKNSNKARVRRASEGAKVTKGEGKRQANSDLRCDKCGKGYKHSSCLYKHLWEHTPEWSITSKLLISKHQQVQLLEAASVLVSMNHEAIESDSSSPEASASAPPSEVLSSAGNTPPPQIEEHQVGGLDNKRFSSNSSVLSRSYQSSIFSEAHNADARGAYYTDRRHVSSDRPNTSGTSVAGSYSDEDREDMSAAFNLLSCSYGTPKSGPVAGQADVPPVPPLPAKYIGQKEQLSGSTITGAPHAYDSFVRGRANVDAGMDLDDAPRRAQSDDEDEGMFGRMEE